MGKRIKTVKHSDYSEFGFETVTYEISAAHAKFVNDFLISFGISPEDCVQDTFKTEMDME